MKKQKVVAVSGGFDPLHAGHIEYLKSARELGDKLVVILNSDDFLKRKKGFVFMPFDERVKVISALSYVDEVMVSVDDDSTVCKSLGLLKPDVFAKGPHWDAEDIPEFILCKELGIKIVDAVGEMVDSSAEKFLRNYNKSPVIDE
jgi:cytidyltransferase-like protein